MSDLIIARRTFEELIPMVLVSSNEVVPINTDGGALINQIQREGKPYDRSAYLAFVNSSRYVILPVPTSIQQLTDTQEGLQLFNPYHDELGRFTDAAHAIGIGAGRAKDDPNAKYAKAPKGSIVVASNFRGSKKAVSEVKRQRQFLKRNLSGMNSDAKVVLGGRMYMPFLSGYYNSYTNTAVISKRRAKGLTKKYNYGHHTLMHELIHTRNGIKRRGQSKREREASTELLARRMSYKMYGRYSSSSYAAPTRYLGNYAMRRSKGNRKNAWKYVSQVHLGKEHLPGPIWLDKSLSFGNGWKLMVEDDDRYKLQEPIFNEPDERIMQVYELLDQEKWDEAMALAQSLNDRALVEDVLETAAHDGYYFDMGESVS